jgi:hypothetical protein
MKIRLWERAWIAFCVVVMLAIPGGDVVRYVVEVRRDAHFRDTVATEFENPVCATIATAPISEVPRPGDLVSGDPCALVAIIRHWRHREGRPDITAAELHAEPVFSLRELARRFVNPLRGAFPLAFAVFGTLYGIGFAVERLVRAVRRTKA